MNVWSDPHEYRENKKCGKFYNLFAEHHPNLKDSILNEKFRSVKEIYSYLNKPRGANHRQPVVLGFAPVQSGKTLSMQCLLAHGIDEGFRLFIISTSNNLSLLSQTNLRFRDDLGLTKKSSFWGVNWLVDLMIEESSNNQEEIQRETIREALVADKKVVVFVNKNIRLEQLRLIIEPILESKTHEPILDSSEIMLLDDESDIGTVDGAPRNQQNEQRTYALMKELAKVAPYSSVYLSTASPWAILHARQYSTFEVDHITYFQPPKTYLGLDIFLPPDGAEQVDTDLGLMVTRAIPLPPNWNETNPDASIREALGFFIIGCLHHFKARETQYSAEHSPQCMFINPGIKKPTHQKVDKVLKNLIKIWKDLARTGDFEFLRKFGYALYYKRMKNYGIQFYSFEELISNWDSFFNHLRGPIVVNSDNTNKDIEDLQDSSLYQIIIGHTILGRGITMKGLTVSYYANNPSNQLDTNYQSARFLGYRKNIEPLCAVYLTERMQNQFQRCRMSEDFFIHEFQEFNLRNIDGRKWEDWINTFLQRLDRLLMDTNLRPTSINKQKRFEGLRVSIRNWRHIWFEYTDEIEKFVAGVLNSLDHLSIEDCKELGFGEDAMNIISDHGSGTYAGRLEKNILYSGLESHKKEALFHIDHQEEVELDCLLSAIRMRNQSEILVFPIKTELENRKVFRPSNINTLQVQSNNPGKREDKLYAPLGPDGQISLQIHKIKPNSHRAADFGLDTNKDYVILSVRFPEDINEIIPNNFS